MIEIKTGYIFSGLGLGLTQFQRILKIFKVNGAMIRKQKRDASEYSSSSIDLTINQAVTVKESFYKTLSYSELFSALGGSLGLWLGVGIMQIIEHLAICGKIVIKVIKLH